MKKFLLFLFSAWACLSAWGRISFSVPGAEEQAPATPVRWSVAVEYPAAGRAELVVSASVEEGWHLYSQYQRGMAQPLRFTLSGPFAADTACWTEIPAYTERTTDYGRFQDTERYHTGTVTYRKRVILPGNDPLEVTLSANGQACRDGACVPVSETMRVALEGGRGRRAEENPASVPVPAPARSSGAEVAPDTIAEVPLPTRRDASATVDSAFSAEAEPETAPPVEEGSETSLGWLFLLAFGGGLLGLLTPCVFPMIPMTVSYFMKHGGKKQALFYGFSIVLIYVVVGVALSALLGQGFANAVSTHWLPNVLFTLIFAAFAFSLLGYFEIRLPSSWISGSDRNADRAGWVGTFFMALTLVLVSFSCTLPIAGAVALGAAGGSFAAPLVGMLGFSLAFALPFTLFAFFPSWLARLPKSGGWMNTLKVTLAFVELAFALKFLSVPDQVYHWHLLDREVYLAAWIVLFGLLGLYLLGKIRFPLDEAMTVQRSPLRFSLAVLSLCFSLYLLPGLWGAPLNALSGWLPPMTTQDFVLSSGAGAAVPSSGRQCLYADELKAPAGIDAFFEYDEAMREAAAGGRPLLLIFTGHGCVNCRLMEQAVLDDDSVRRYLAARYTVAFLYVDDKVLELPDGARLAPDGRTEFRLLGEKNLWIENYLFGQNAQPCHVVVDPVSGNVLAGPSFYETDVDKYLAFLREGTASFGKKQ